jgi:hypothetical protein
MSSMFKVVVFVSLLNGLASLHCGGSDGGAPNGASLENALVQCQQMPALANGCTGTQRYFECPTDLDLSASCAPDGEWATSGPDGGDAQGRSWCCP